MSTNHAFMCYIEEGGAIHGTICSQYIEHGWYSDLNSRSIKLIFELGSTLSMRYLAFAVSSDNVNWEVLHVQDSQNNADANVTIPESYDGTVKFGIKLYDSPPSVGSILNVGFDYVITGGIDLSSSNAKKVAMSCATDGAVIKYTLDNTDPTEESTEYIEEIEVEPPVTIKARGFKDGLLDGDIATLVFELMEFPQTPTLSLTRSGTTVRGTIGNAVEDATYRYKVGSAPTSETDGTAISGTSFSFTNSSAVTVYVVGFKDGYLPSDAVSDSVSAYVPTCATPSISQSGNTVTFTCSTSGATIHYSGCGKSGTCSSGGSVTITQSGTMTAYATRSGYNTSGTASRSCTYTPQNLPIPVVNASYSDAGDTFSVRVTVTNASSFPSGTTFSGSWETRFGTGGQLASNTTGTWSFNSNIVNGLSGTVTASCAGYNSSSASF